jgi:hypothetical protein
MAGISNARGQLNVKLTGSHAGVSIGEDGPSQMALEDLAMMRAVPNCTVLYPCDGVSSERLVAEMSAHPGLAYMRTSRPKTEVIYSVGDRFPIGGSKVLYESTKDVATVVAAGVTVFEARKAYEQLKAEGAFIRVIDAYSVQPIDAGTLVAAATATRGVVITVEDHYAAGGLGDAVSEAIAPAGFAVQRLAVRGATQRSGSGTARSLRHFCAPHRRCGPCLGARDDEDSMIFSRALANVAATLALADAVGAVRPHARGVRIGWAPDGKRLAFSYLDRIWVSAPDGKNGKALRPDSTEIEREPCWSPDGRSIAFAAARGRGFDIVVTAVDSGARTPASASRAITSLDGDERWPSWTSDGRIVFSHRPAGGRWRLYVTAASGGDPKPLFSDTEKDDERYGRVSPDGKRIAYVSDRDSEDGDADLWVAELALAPRDRVTRTRLLRVRGVEGFPAWAPDSSRLAFFAVREGAGSVWVLSADQPASPPAGGPGVRPRPAEPPVLVSRHGGAPSWSPDGKRIAIANLPAPEPTYNATRRGTRTIRRRCVARCIPVVDGRRAAAGRRRRKRSPRQTLQEGQLVGAFDRVGNASSSLLLDRHSGDGWQALKDRHRPQAQAARDEAELEAALDAMVTAAHQAGGDLGSRGGCVRPSLASRAGALRSKKAAASSTRRSCLVRARRRRPDASGIGGDGMALVYLKSMAEPVAIDYGSTPSAPRDNPLLTASTGYGASAANIPGVVAGLDLLYRKYGSKVVSWADLIAPAVEYAEAGYVLDETLPTSIAEGRRYFEKYPAAARIYLPDGRVPAAGDRFVNKDYAATLRAIAKEGADAFYRGFVARRIAEDMGKNGGLIPSTTSRSAERSSTGRSPDVIEITPSIQLRHPCRRVCR